MKNTIDKKLQWHPACFAALNLELIENKRELELVQEYAINELPLRVDALIVKKNRKCNIKNEIGKIFRTYNLVEYKSPADELSFDTFLKGIAQAYLYKVCCDTDSKILLDDISLTFIRESKPIKLFKTLYSYDFVIEEKFKGLYYISGRNLIPIQIVVSKQLDIKNHRWLSSLTKRLSRDNAEELICLTNQLVEDNDKKYADTVWEIVTRANNKLIEKMKEEKSMCKAMAEIFKPEIDAAVAAVKDTAFSEGFNDGFNDGFNNGFNNGFSNGIDDKGMQVFRNMIQRGFSVKDAQSLVEISDKLVERALAENK